MDSKLYLGDSVKVMEQLKDCSIDCIITDPPYNLGLFMHKRNTNLVKMRENQFAYAGWDNLEYNKWRECMNVFLKQSHRVLKKSGTLIIFMSILKVETIFQLAQENGFYYKTTGIWHKTNPMPRNYKLQFVNSTECWMYFVKDDTTGTFNYDGKPRHDFLESSLTPMSEKKYGKHPTQKPIKILTELIKRVTNKGDAILDPFMGSGSTCVASAMLDRKYIGIEINEEYYKIAKQRIESLEGKV